MRQFLSTLCIVAACIAAPVAAQVPGAPDKDRVKAGEYHVDAAHSQVAFSVNHFGFNAYHGLFGDLTGTLTLDPAAPEQARMNIEIPLTRVTTTSDQLDGHLQTPDFFDTANHPKATFRSTDITVSGDTAQITSDLTIGGVTQPVVLAARFIGAGTNPMNKAETIGFEANAQVRRSDLGVDYGLPAVADLVNLRITVAFERQQ